VIRFWVEFRRHYHPKFGPGLGVHIDRDVKPLSKRATDFLTRFGRTKSDYAYCKGLTKSEWAWEFLRRNPDYKCAFIVSRSRLSQIARLNTGTPVMRSRGCQAGASDWDLECFSDPDLSAVQTPIFWSQAALKHHAEAEAEIAEPDPAQADLDVLRDRNCAAILERRHGVSVLFRTTKEAIDLQITGANILLSPVHLTFRIVGFNTVKSRAATLLLLLPCIQKRLSDNAEPLPRHQRLCLLKALVALDCKQSGGSLQETAIVFRALGLTRLSWSTIGDESLKKQVIRARNRGLKFMQGGYRTLLY
jgi:hypothetical protein